MGEIIVNGQPFPVPFPVRHDLALTPDAARPLWLRADERLPARRCEPRAYPERLNLIVVHHDATLSSAPGRGSAYGVLLRRGLSTHFGIDNDATIWQFLDPWVWTAWHEGKTNGRSVGIDLSNACELRFSGRYNPPREIKEQLIHGARVRWLAPYPQQIEALATLCRALHEAIPSIPLQVPLSDGKARLEVLPGRPVGVVGHLHLNVYKADPFGVDWSDLQRRLVED